MLNRLCYLWILSLLLLLCRSTSAQTSAITFTGVTGGFQDGVPRVIGWEFTTGSQALLVEQLGVFDFQEDGLQMAHDVAIFSNQTHNAIVSATVSTGNSAPLSGFFRYASVSPTLLQADTEYVVAAAWSANGDPFVWTPSIGSPSADIQNLVINPALTLGLTVSGLPASARFEDTTSVLQFPNKRIGDIFPGDPRTLFVGPNFTFSVATVPEPGLVGLIAGIIVPGIGVLIRRLRKK